MGQRNGLTALLEAIESEFGLSAEVTVDPQVLANAIAGLAPWAKPLLEPRRYKGLYGGRGAGKSVAVADALLIAGVQQTERVLCGREFQNSISDSVHQLLCDRIDALGLGDFYRIQESRIFGPGNTEFFFKGLRHNIRSVKSIPGITKVWMEEAETTSQNTWDVLVPTIRASGSEIWVTFNSHLESDPIYQMFALHPERLAGETYIQKVSWRDNPHFPKELDDERRKMLATDPDRYQHIYEGECWQRSDAQVLSGKWVVDEFTPGSDWHGPYHGADFGFAQDPTTLGRWWVHENRLYLEYESWAIGLELDATAPRWAADVPGCEAHTIRGDSARPETISYLRRHGMPNIVGVKKGPGSVEDGVAHLLSYQQIIIHPRCKHAIEEARLWSYRVDRLTGDVLPTLAAGYDHLVCDGGRYALQPLIKPRRDRTHRAHAVRNW